MRATRPSARSGELGLRGGEAGSPHAIAVLWVVQVAASSASSFAAASSIRFVRVVNACSPGRGLAALLAEGLVDRRDVAMPPGPADGSR